jgi:hypothetical protein
VGVQAIVPEDNATFSCPRKGTVVTILLAAFNHLSRSVAVASVGCAELLEVAHVSFLRR